jgi:hypothetical protein
MVVRVARVVRLTWMAGIALALLALVVIGIAVAVVLVGARAQPGRASPTVCSRAGLVRSTWANGGTRHCRTHFAC